MLPWADHRDVRTPDVGARSPQRVSHLWGRNRPRVEKLFVSPSTNVDRGWTAEGPVDRQEVMTVFENWPDLLEDAERFREALIDD
ncbi:hypothetical protein BRC85_01715 [Halobacteriales archaeon QS_1_69_70]|nr:MAG: hypothetical protein BRC85_01715 [Halobacteriales archaeon QS_1_69_70]